MKLWIIALSVWALTSAWCNFTKSSPDHYQAIAAEGGILRIDTVTGKLERLTVGPSYQGITTYQWVEMFATHEN